jgi:uncharacterized 2Fe-2S/4Fe-4S cluster protein (DUF4445 family)
VDISNNDQHRITYHRENAPEQEQTLMVPAGIRLDEAVAQAGYDLRKHCGGAGICGKCQIIVEHQKVLACQTVVTSDLDVLIPNTSLRVNEQDVVVPMTTHLPPLKRNGESFPPKEGNYYGSPPLEGCHNGVVVQRMGEHYGVAIDIGTTTLVAELHDFTGKLPVQIASCANPQRQFGDDVITRIQKIMENPSALIAMQQCIVGVINRMITELAEKNGITPQEISLMIVAGNTVMQSILFGIDPSPLGESPFRPPVETFPARRGNELGLIMSPEGMVEAFPIFGGFVGGDIVAGVLTLPKLLLADAPSFFLDIGTNGEIVLAHRDESRQNKLSAAATAAGPTFEGARIEHGILAVPGAIDHVNIESGTITVSTLGNQPAIGICGSGLIDAVAVLLEQGIIQPNGKFSGNQSHVELVSATQSGIGEAIILTQRDIRELQLAVGAIRAGITLLLQENNVPLETIETFYVAGGFGQSIRLSSARRIGLLPPLPAERFQFCGNTSLTGARAMLLNPNHKQTVQHIIQQSHHYELASLPQFQEVFAASMRWGEPEILSTEPNSIFHTSNVAFLH